MPDLERKTPDDDITQIHEEFIGAFQPVARFLSKCITFSTKDFKCATLGMDCCSVQLGLMFNSDVCLTSHSLSPWLTTSYWPTTTI